MKKHWKPLLSAFFLVYGIYYAFAMRRDFQNTEMLTWCLLGIIPIFVALYLLDHYGESWRRYQHGWIAYGLEAIHWTGAWSTQSIVQYILTFCLPFFLFGDHFVYLGITGILLLTTLWDGWWDNLFRMQIGRAHV